LWWLSRFSGDYYHFRLFTPRFSESVPPPDKR
jgi:hypothetical protein